MSGTERRTATITPVDESGAEVGDPIELEYQFPFVDTSSKSRTVKFEPIGEETVVQHMGSSAQEITAEGHCYRNEANRLDNLADQGYILIITDRWQGTAVVDSVDTNTSGNGGGKRSNVNDRIYDYTLNLTEINGRAPTG